MAPARLTRPLDPIYQGSTWTQPIYVLDEDADGVQTPADLTGVPAILSLVRMGLPAASKVAFGFYEGEGLLLFSKTAVGEAADGWIPGRYAIELTLEEQSVLVGEVMIVQGANAGGSAGQMPGAAQVPGVVTVARAATGAVHLVRTDRVTLNSDAEAIPIPADLGALFGGATNLAAALAYIATHMGSGPSPIVQLLAGNIVASSVASGSLSVGAAQQILLTGAISSTSSVAGSLSVLPAGGASLVGTAYSQSVAAGALSASAAPIAVGGNVLATSTATGSLSVGAASVALVGTALSTSMVVGALTVTDPPLTTALTLNDQPITLNSQPITKAA